MFNFMFVGLGTSSILGGVIMAALWRAAGQEHTHDSLIHAVSGLIVVPITFHKWFLMLR